jgi:APA family basic amino acid/polyamine antiporter
MLKGLIVFFGYPFVPALYIIVTTAICIISIRHFKYRFGTGIVALGIPVYYFLMDNKKNSSCWAIF